MTEPVRQMSIQTDMRLYRGADWTASGHVVTDTSYCDHDVQRAAIAMRRVGWLDQTGKVWLDSKDWQRCGGPGGSITPLLIEIDCD